jgi:glutamate N-acetyltransferase/amino-acid N-acetyltransferase
MAVGLEAPGRLSPVGGVRLASVAAGIRYPDRDDLVLIELASGSVASAVFTRNAFCAAPVMLARQHLSRGAPRYLLINSGNANAGNGEAGMDDARASCAAVSGATGCEPERVLPFSTGVIGEPLPVERIAAALPRAVAGLDRDGWLDAARAIMTTDTLPKGGSRELELSGGSVRITGIAKGAGMIRPDMATMLAFVATDAVVEPALLDRTLRDAVERSFNAITVDGDTSTNDAMVLIATGASGVAIETPEDQQRFDTAIGEICEWLAQAIVRDAEGATKFVTIDVLGAETGSEARSVAYTVAHSPLVKTALFASDPNWGRILAAVGRAGVEGLDVSRVEIALGDVVIVRGGGRADDYTEAAGQRVMAQDEITLRIDLGRGHAAARVWTSDLSFDYVRINAEYRT